MKYAIEIIQDSDGSYYANMTMGGTDWNGTYCDSCSIDGLPEYVDYRTLSTAIKNRTGITIPPRKALHFFKFGRKKCAYIDATQTRKNGCCVTADEVKNGWEPDFT